jgi:hypothetical protein
MKIKKTKSWFTVNYPDGTKGKAYATTKANASGQALKKLPVETQIEITKKFIEKQYAALAAAVSPEVKESIWPAIRSAEERLTKLESLKKS